MDLTELSFITVPIIVSIVYFVISAIKKATGYNEKFLRVIPIVAAAMGVVLGIVFFLIAPEEITMAKSLWSAAFIGGASGLAATGTNQMIKQLSSEPVQSQEKIGEAAQT